MPTPPDADPPSRTFPLAENSPVKIAVFSTKPYDRVALEAADPQRRHDLVYFEPRLTADTAPLAHGFDAVCPFVNDQLSADVVQSLAEGGVRLLTLRSAGFNHVDLRCRSPHGIRVARVPAYSPYAVAEHASGLF
jgi:D-lactate dehydrogenase